ncbi:MAG: hypothetical protein K2R98_32665 [Gemmataceae bacterium]|nr:hypothetical protein [Gemmataceae bacterium]
MTPIRTCLLTAAALLLAAPVFAQEAKKAKAPVAYVTKTYAVGHLLHGTDADQFVNAITHSVKPASWGCQGSSKATIRYFPLGDALIVKQTPAGHEQIESLLRALDRLRARACPPCAPPMAVTCPLPPPVQSAGFVAASPVPCCPPPLRFTGAPAPCRTEIGRCSQPSHAKQYGHFVLEDIKVNAMGVSCTVKRMRFMYRGDGIDPDVAKCALTGEYEKKPEPAAKDTACCTDKKADCGCGCKCGDCKCGKSEEKPQVRATTSMPSTATPQSCISASYLPPHPVAMPSCTTSSVSVPSATTRPATVSTRSSSCTTSSVSSSSTTPPSGIGAACGAVIGAAQGCESPVEKKDKDDQADSNDDPGA